MTANASPLPRRRPVIGFRFNVHGTAFVLLLIAAWELLTDAGVIHYIYLPAPSRIIGAGADLARTGQLFPPLSHTVLATFIGWGMSSVIGLVLGLILGGLRWVRIFTLSSFEVIRSIPAVAFLPVVILVFGFTVKAELALIVYIASWPMMLSAMHGIRSVPASYLDVARIIRLSRWEKIRKVVLPSAAPEIVVGLRLTLALSLTMAVVAELLADPEGLGYSLSQQQQYGKPAELFAFFLLIGILGVILNVALVTASRLTMPTMRNQQSATAGGVS